MTIWDWIFVFYAAIALALFAAMWVLKTPTEKAARMADNNHCQCLHPIKCDLFDKCMRNEK